MLFILLLSFPEENSVQKYPVLLGIYFLFIYI